MTETIYKLTEYEIKGITHMSLDTLIDEHLHFIHLLDGTCGDVPKTRRPMYEAYLKELERRMDIRGIKHGGVF